MTRRDLLKGDAHLLEPAGERLAQMPFRRLAVAASSDADGTPLLDVMPTGPDRLDVHVEDRPGRP